MHNSSFPSLMLTEISAIVCIGINVRITFCLLEEDCLEPNSKYFLTVSLRTFPHAFPLSGRPSPHAFWDLSEYRSSVLDPHLRAIFHLLGIPLLTDFTVLFLVVLSFYKCCITLAIYVGTPKQRVPVLRIERTASVTLALLIKPEQPCLCCKRHWPCSKQSFALIIFKARLYLLLLRSVGADKKVLPKSSPVFHKRERKWNEVLHKAFFQQSSSVLQQYVAREILHLRGLFMIMIFPCSYMLSSILNLVWKVSVQFVSFMHLLVSICIAML